MEALNTTKGKTTNLTLIIDVDVVETLKARAADNDRSLSAEVRRILRDAIEADEAAA